MELVRGKFGIEKENKEKKLTKIFEENLPVIRSHEEARKYLKANLE